MTRFLDSLKPGQLAFAGNMTAQKVHVIPLVTTAYDESLEGLHRNLTKAARAKAIADIDPKRRHMWSAEALCGVRGEHAHYGNYSRYFWRPQENPSLDQVCKGCLKEWRKRGEPEIQGFDRTASNAGAWPWALPFGWQEVPVVGHPWDLPKDVAVESVKDDTGKVRGEHRVEIRRFVRGPRIVRLVHHLDEDTYSARYWDVGADADGESYALQGTLMAARRECHKLMAKGGYR